MTETVHIIQDSTETLETILPAEFRGPPTSPQVRIYTPSTPLPDDDSWENATAESLSANTNAAAAKGDRTLSFASDPSVVPLRVYTLDTDQGVEVRPLDTGTSVTLEHPLPVAVPSGTTLYSRTVTHDLTAAETATVGPGFAIFKATDANGDVQVWRVAFEVVKARIQIPLTEPELLAAWPNAGDMTPSETTPEKVIAAAWANIILPELRSRGIEEEMIFNVEPLRPPLIEAVRWSLMRDQGEDRAELDRALKIALSSSDWWEAASRETDQPGPDQPAKPFGTFTLRR